MQQRRLRLGDILDDYCPRERRITNHVVVAMIEDEVKQTRCTTCDADHEYKQGKAPPARRRKDGVPRDEAADAGRPLAAAADVEMVDDDEFMEAGGSVEEAPPAVVASAGAPAPADDATEADDDMARSADDEGPVHRRLIRATLPRPEGQAPERKMPEFTVRQPGGNSPGRGDFDANRAGGEQQRHGRGRRSMRGPSQPGQSTGGPHRFGGPRPAPTQGPRQDGNRSGPPSGQRSGDGRPGQGHPHGSRQPGRKRGR